MDAAGEAAATEGALVLSLHLLEAYDDDDDDDDDVNVVLPPGGDDDASVRRRARTYLRLCEACRIANDVLLRSSSSRSAGDDDAHHHRPWSSGGDGPLFGVHRDDASDDERDARDADDERDARDADGDELWQTQLPGPSSSQDEELADVLLRRRRIGPRVAAARRGPGRPHLRAVCRYGNDVDDAWRSVALAFRITALLSSRGLPCAVRCWDAHDGHVLLIEAADVLPDWVDDDPTQGGAGGPDGCTERCWVMDGGVHLLPPRMDPEAEARRDLGSDAPTTTEPGGLSRGDALRLLAESVATGGGTRTRASDAIRDAILDRIDRADFGPRARGRRIRDGGRSTSNDGGALDDAVDDDAADDEGGRPSHWHVAAAAVPASVARFLERHPEVAPLLVEAFCDRAPSYLRDRRRAVDREARGDDSERANGERSEGTNPTDSSAANGARRGSARELGRRFPYERIVVVPVALTRARYAELASGRGTVPGTFPVPAGYRSVELNRLRRRLRQHAVADVLDDDEGRDDGAGRRKMRNPFANAVDVGVRLCAGLDWILSDEDDDCAATRTKEGPASIDDAAMAQGMGDTERRLRLHWTRIDAEATAAGSGGVAAAGPNGAGGGEASLPWIERAWRAGPNGSGGGGGADGSLLRALEAMSRCPVFEPELSRPVAAEPCPQTRPGASLRDVARSGMRAALRWQAREEGRAEEYFPMPNVREVDDDGWMEVGSLAELEEEMRKLSSPRKADADPSGATSEKRPRRTTRRSRRNLARANNDRDADGSDGRGDGRSEDAAPSPSRVLDGLRSFVEGEGELEGAVAGGDAAAPPDRGPRGGAPLGMDGDPEELASGEVNVDPRKFLDVLHAVLRDETTPGIHGPGGTALDNETAVAEAAPPDVMGQDVSKYFFQEDLDDGDSSDDSELGDGEGVWEEKRDDQTGTDEDPWSLQNIMRAMDHELRIDGASHPSIKGLSAASEETSGGGASDDGDLAVLSNLLRSIDAQGGGGAGPASTILRGMGVLPPRPPDDDDD